MIGLKNWVVMKLEIGKSYKIIKECTWWSNKTKIVLSDGIILYIKKDNEINSLFFLYNNMILSCCLGVRWDPSEFLEEIQCI